VSGISQIGNYKLVAELASGAFGHVYLAQHTILKNRSVAIKLMHSVYLGSSQERDRFIQEAQFLEVLKHPHILPIIDVGMHEGFPYLVAEYAPNGSLRDRIKRRAPRLLPMEEITAILSQVGQALQYAHQQNIIHRDLKPENILFNAKGEALLADFGLATLLTTGSVKQSTITGTVAYMAPEQLQGSICRESDQYALGCITYELFTGRMPFSATDLVTLIVKRLTEDPIVPRQLNPDLPHTY